MNTDSKKYTYMGKNIDDLSFEEMKEALICALESLEAERKIHKSVMSMWKFFDENRLEQKDI